MCIYMAAGHSMKIENHQSCLFKQEIQWNCIISLSLSSLSILHDQYFIQLFPSQITNMCVVFVKISF